MLASELIKKLQGNIDVYGDCDVRGQSNDIEFPELIKDEVVTFEKPKRNGGIYRFIYLKLEFYT